MPGVIYNRSNCQSIQNVITYNLLEETALQPSCQHLNSSKITIQQLSGDLNISTVFSGALEQVTTCGVRAANQVYRESKVFDSYIDLPQGEK
jgi:arsenate reductase-like glutaredoxin family protein